MIKDQRKSLQFLAVFAAGLVAGVLLIHFWPPKPEPPPDTSRLKDLLLNTAQRDMGVPPLGDIELDLSVEQGKLDREVDRIRGLAAKFGGTAVVGAAGEKGKDILAQVSRGSAPGFVDAVRHPEKEPVVPVEADTENSAFLVEIRLESRG
jgi:hypothetical protein